MPATSPSPASTSFDKVIYLIKAEILSVSAELYYFKIILNKDMETQKEIQKVEDYVIYNLQIEKGIKVFRSNINLSYTRLNDLEEIRIDL